MRVEQSERLAQVNYAIRGPVLDAAYKLEAAGETVLKLNIGNPGPFDFEVAESLQKAVQDNLIGRGGAQSYSHSQGILEAREAVAKYHTGRGLPNVTPADIYMGNGASELIVMCMQGLLNPGDEVLVPAPDYPLWTASVNLASGNPVHYICDEENHWNPSVADMASKITDKTRAIVLINPNNPTGAVYSQEILLEIIELAKKHNLVLFSDEIYDRILFDDIAYTSLGKLAGDYPVFTFNGISKTHLACGFRGGWLAISGDKSGMETFIEGLNTLSSMRLCSNVMAQYACKAALEEDNLYLEMRKPGGRIYDQGMKAWKALNAIDGISCEKPQGALYLFPKIDAERFGIVSDEKFVLDFLLEKKVLLVHGTGFNWPEPNHFRVVFLPEESVILDAIERLGDFLKTYKQEA